MPVKRFLFIAVVVLLAVVGPTSLTVAQGPTASGPRAPQAAAGTAFTYQGYLKKDGVPVTASCYLSFKLWDAADSGTVVHNWVAGMPSPAQVSAGLFVVTVDFGANVFNGDARWIETMVRCLPESGYTTQSPRQPLTPAPMAFALPGLYTQQNETSPNVIGGYNGNVISDTVRGATIAGGGQATFPNRVWSWYATVGGGYGNTASGSQSVVAGGNESTASSYAATVGGGSGNTASGYYATVPGGMNNTAGGWYSLAAGRSAKANHSGTFVWADSTNANFESTADNQFLIRAGNGVGINSPGPFTAALSVNGQIVAGGITVPSGAGEPFVATGSNAGISLDDREGGIHPRWVVYANNGELNFYNEGNVMTVGSFGQLKIGALGTPGTQDVCVNAAMWLSQCSSSLRYKNNVAPLTLGLDTVAQLRPVTFDWKDSGTPDLGLVAEEADQVTPLLTTRNAQGQIEGVKYDRLSAVLVNAIQEQQQQIAALQKENGRQQQEIAELKQNVAQTETRLDALEQAVRANGVAGHSDTQGVPIAWVLIGGVGLGAGVALSQRRREGSIP